MTNDTMKAGHGYLSILAGGEPLNEDVDLVRATVKAGVTTSKAGMAMTRHGETFPDVDIFANGDENFLGLWYAPAVRPLNSSTFDDDYDVDDTVAAATEILLLRPSGGKKKVRVFISGLDGGGTLVAGDPVYLYDSGIPGVVCSNATAGDLLCLPSGTSTILTDASQVTPTSPGATREPIQVGVLAQDLSLGDSTSQAANKVAEIWY